MSKNKLLLMFSYLISLNRYCCAWSIHFHVHVHLTPGKVHLYLCHLNVRVCHIFASIGENITIKTEDLDLGLTIIPNFEYHDTITITEITIERLLRV